MASELTPEVLDYQQQRVITAIEKRWLTLHIEPDMLSAFIAAARRLAEYEAALRIADEALSVCVGNNADTRHKRAEARQQIATALSTQGAAEARVKAALAVLEREGKSE